MVCLLFCCSVILLNLIVWYLARKEYLAFFDIFTSQVVTALIKLSGLQAVRDGNTIYLANSVWLVTSECNATFIMVIFSSFIFSYPSQIKAKVLALLTGIPLIFGANVLRLFIMAWLDKLKPEYSEYFHNYVWQVVFIVMVVYMWIIWLDTTENHETKSAVPR
jgi:exosortase/archaeosortase family protein